MLVSTQSWRQAAIAALLMSFSVSARSTFRGRGDSGLQSLLDGLNVTDVADALNELFGRGEKSPAQDPKVDPAAGKTAVVVSTEAATDVASRITMTEEATAGGGAATEIVATAIEGVGATTSSAGGQETGVAQPAGRTPQQCAKIAAQLEKGTGRGGNRGNGKGRGYNRGGGGSGGNQTATDTAAATETAVGGSNDTAVLTSTVAAGTGADAGATLPSLALTPTKSLAITPTPVGPAAKTEAACEGSPTAKHARHDGPASQGDGPGNRGGRGQGAGGKTKGRGGKQAAIAECAALGVDITKGAAVAKEQADAADAAAAGDDWNATATATAGAGDGAAAGTQATDTAAVTETAGAGAGENVATTTPTVLATGTTAVTESAGEGAQATVTATASTTSTFAADGAQATKTPAVGGQNDGSAMKDYKKPAQEMNAHHKREGSFGTRAMIIAKLKARGVGGRMA